jgi:hypothetical protein
VTKVVPALSSRAALRAVCRHSETNLKITNQVFNSSKRGKVLDCAGHGELRRIRSRLLGLLNGFLGLDRKELEVGKGVFNDHPALGVIRVRHDELR